MILWDADGVLFDTLDADGAFRWSANIEADLGITPAILEDIFKSAAWNDVLRGLASEEGHIAQVFERRGIALSPAAFIDYWLTRDCAVNEAVAAYLNPVNACIATNQSLARAQMIDRVFGTKIRALYVSCAMSTMKPEPLFFSMIERHLKRPPDVLCLIDDAPENVEAALSRGWRAHRYTDPQSLRAFLKNTA